MYFQKDRKIDLLRKHIAAKREAAAAAARAKEEEESRRLEAAGANNGNLRSETREHELQSVQGIRGRV